MIYGKTKFKETRYSVSKTIPYYIFEEGIGGSGYYEVDGVIDVRKNVGHYDATVSAKARTNAGRFGKAVFSCTAISYVNGAKRDEKKLQGGVNAVENVGWCNLGAATIILPAYETNVEIGLGVGYLLYTAASMHGATNVPANWIYDNVWKKMGEFFGAIRQAGWSRPNKYKLYYL